mmetsp:Transcript_11064/g.20005  ORF Transcript_11064/g.20005 Transcript_11064/m.20005 type:complete len:196 (-) Transcript_11064:66-653(-)
MSDELARIVGDKDQRNPVDEEMSKKNANQAVQSGNSGDDQEDKDGSDEEDMVSHTDSDSGEEDVGEIGLGQVATKKIAMKTVATKAPAQGSLKGRRIIEEDDDEDESEDDESMNEQDEENETKATALKSLIGKRPNKESPAEETTPRKSQRVSVTKSKTVAGKRLSFPSSKPIKRSPIKSNSEDDDDNSEQESSD